MSKMIDKILGSVLVGSAMLVLTGFVLPEQAMPKVWKAGTVVSAETVKQTGPEQWFTQEPLSDAVVARMRGKSYPTVGAVPMSSLRYLKMLHHDGEGRVRMGEMVCNKLIADDLIEIFRELYLHGYSIGSMRLIDDFGADDERSMRANNSSCYCHRTVSGTEKLSAHARGMAVDINPLYNPYCKKGKDAKVKVQPSNALKYCDRTAVFPYKIDKDDLAYRLFVRHGFRWGGAWHTVKDYQHFEK